MILFQVLLLLGLLPMVRSQTWPIEGSCEPCRCSLQRTYSHGLVTHVDCSGLHLERIPHNLPKDLESLDLSFNQVSTVTINSACEFESLQYLSLAYNPLISSGGSPFSKCSLLVKLNITGSGVSYLNRNYLAGLYNVQEIYGLVSENVEYGSFEKLETLVIMEFTFTGHGIPEGIFNGLQIETLNLTMCNVTNVPRRLFQFGDMTLQFLFVYGPNVTNIHGALLRGLQVLRGVSLNFPKLPLLPERLFVNFGMNPEASNPTHLREIVLRGMQSIPRESFRFLGGIVRLSIHDVHDVAVHGLFDDLVNLEVLNLNGCNVIDLPLGWFEMLENLKTLDLSDTTLRSLEEMAFYGPTQLSTVDLSMNALRDLDEFPFRPLRLSIRRLSFRSNILKTLDEGILKEMFGLQYLDLSDNKLSEISPDIFADLKNLTNLQLQENKFYSLPKNLFRNQHVLETLHLGVNYFSGIPVAVTSPAISLRVLHLYDNKIENIPFSLHDDLPHLEYLSLLDNPVFCHCEVFSQRFYLRNLFIDAVCNSPAQYSKRHVMRIEIPYGCPGHIPQSYSNLVSIFLFTKPHNDYHYYGSNSNNRNDDISSSISEETYIIESYDVGHTAKWTYSALNPVMSTQPSVITSGHARNDIDGQSRLSHWSTKVNVHPSESVPVEPVTTTAYPREWTSFRIVTEPIASEMRHRSTDRAVASPSAVYDVLVTTRVAPTSTPRLSPVPVEPVTTTAYPREWTSFRIVTEPIASEMRHRSTDRAVASPSAVYDVLVTTRVAPTSTPRLSPTRTSRVDADHLERGTLGKPHGNVFEEEGDIVMKASYTEAILYGLLSFVLPVGLTATVVWIWYRRYTVASVTITKESSCACH